MFSGGYGSVDFVPSQCGNEKQRVVRSFDYNGDGFEDKFMAKACYNGKNQRLAQESYYLEMSNPNGIGKNTLDPKPTTSSDSGYLRFDLPNDFSMAGAEIMTVNMAPGHHRDYAKPVQFHQRDLVSAIWMGVKEDGLRVKGFSLNLTSTGELISSVAHIYDKKMEDGTFFIHSPIVEDLTLISPVTELDKVVDEIFKNLSGNTQVKHELENRRNILKYARFDNLNLEYRAEIVTIDAKVMKNIDALVISKNLDPVGYSYVSNRVIMKVGEIAGGPFPRYSSSLTFGMR